jgi:hypothetical protein
VKALGRTDSGTFEVDLESEEIAAANDEVRGSERQSWPVPRVVASSSAGSTIVLVVERKPPLLVSNDAGATWRDAGGGLPPGFAVAVAADDPDLIVYASRNRLHVSTNGGVFWRALAPELPAIEALELREA